MNFIETVYASEPIKKAVEGAGHATEAAADGGVLASLGINGTLFIFQLINFIAVALILWFLILKPLTKKMAERQKMIDASIENSRKVETNLMMSERKFQERVDDAKVEANKITEKAQQEAVKLGDDMKVKAKEDIELLVEQARKNIKAERDESINEVREQAANLVVMATEKILSSKLDSTKDKKIIEEAVESMKI
ncbi:MAG: F0F1 ATP synthase subunit B [Patescibacteria group bacterium]